MEAEKMWKEAGRGVRDGGDLFQSVSGGSKEKWSDSG